MKKLVLVVAMFMFVCVVHSLLRLRTLQKLRQPWQKLMQQLSLMIQ